MNKYPFEPGFVQGSDTSAEAAKSMGADAPSLRDQIFAHINQSGRGLTCDEIEEVFEIRHQTASARIRELVMFGKLVDSGERRKTRSGRSARVYDVVDEAA
jgi:predicted ArsR family transcriptional regulator